MAFLVSGSQCCCSHWIFFFQIAILRPRRRSREVWGNPILWREICTRAYGRAILLVRVAWLLLFAAARAQLVREVIAPALMAGKIVLSDRFLDSSTVYQGIARNLAADPVAQINRFAVGNVMPHLTVVIDVPTEVSLARLKQRASDLPDRMERENIDFYTKVREGYLVLAQGMPERFILVDGTKTADVIEKKIWSEIQARLG